MTAALPRFKSAPILVPYSATPQQLCYAIRSTMKQIVRHDRGSTYARNTVDRCDWCVFGGTEHKLYVHSVKLLIRVHDSLYTSCGHLNATSMPTSLVVTAEATDAPGNTGDATELTANRFITMLVDNLHASYLFGYKLPRWLTG